MKIITETAVTLFEDMVPRTVGIDHPRFEEIKELALLDQIDHALELMDMKAEIINAVDGTDLSIEGSEVTYKGFVLPEVLGKRIIELNAAEGNIQPLANFCEKLFNNPRREVVEELYDFLEASSLPLTEDGCFVAYKGVDLNFKDIYTGTMDNSVGATPTMERWEVDTDRDRTCSHGLHFAAYEYARNWAGGRGHDGC